MTGITSARCPTAAPTARRAHRRDHHDQHRAARAGPCPGGAALPLRGRRHHRCTASSGSPNSGRSRRPRPAASSSRSPGPLVNLLIGIPALIWYQLVDPNTTVGVFVFGLAWINIALGVFNLLPGLPLDGGAAFAASRLEDHRRPQHGHAGRRLLRVRGRRRAGGDRGLRDAQQRHGSILFAADRRDDRARCRRLAQAQPRRREAAVADRSGRRAKAVTVDANLPLSEALRRAQAEDVTAVIVADSSGRPWAVMNGAAADAVPAERRPWTTINQVSRPIEDGMRIPESLGGQELMERLSQTPRPRNTSSTARTASPPECSSWSTSWPASIRRPRPDSRRAGERPQRDTGEAVAGQRTARAVRRRRSGPADRRQGPQAHRRSWWPASSSTPTRAPSSTTR